MILVEERCAFLDVHRDMVMACGRYPDDTGERIEQVQSFTTTSKGLLELSGWLVDRGIGRIKRISRARSGIRRETRSKGLGPRLTCGLKSLISIAQRDGNDGRSSALG